MSHEVIWVIVGTTAPMFLALMGLIFQVGSWKAATEKNNKHLSELVESNKERIEKIEDRCERRYHECHPVT